jgi:hypothetical protein
MQIAIVTEVDNATITIYEFQNLTNPSLNTPKATISRSALPGGLDFFTGFTGNNGDVYSQAPQQGNGGDMMFNRDGSKVIFVTRESPENELLRSEASGIYEYGLTSGQINLLYNDVNQQERQPIFVDGTGIIPEPEQVITISPTISDYGIIEFESTKINQFTITNTGTVAAEITSVSLGSASQFAITATNSGANPPYAFTLQPGNTATFDVTYAPTTVGKQTATLTVTYAADKSVSSSLTGVGKAKPQESVARDYREVFTFSVAPNPVIGAATITLTGVETSKVQLELVDATGRTAWTASSMLSAGSTSTFDLNATNLAAGSYFLVVRAADVQGVSQVVITK